MSAAAATTASSASPLDNDSAQHQSHLSLVGSTDATSSSKAAPTAESHIHSVAMRDAFRLHPHEAVAKYKEKVFAQFGKLQQHLKRTQEATDQFIKSFSPRAGGADTSNKPHLPKQLSSKLGISSFIEFPDCNARDKEIFDVITGLKKDLKTEEYKMQHAVLDVMVKAKQAYLGHLHKQADRATFQQQQTQLFRTFIMESYAVTYNRRFAVDVASPEAFPVNGIAADFESQLTAHISAVTLNDVYAESESKKQQQLKKQAENDAAENIFTGVHNGETFKDMIAQGIAESNRSRAGSQTADATMPLVPTTAATMSHLKDRRRHRTAASSSTQPDTVLGKPVFTFHPGILSSAAQFSFLAQEHVADSDDIVTVDAGTANAKRHKQTHHDARVKRRAATTQSTTESSEESMEVDTQTPASGGQA